MSARFSIYSNYFNETVPNLYIGNYHAAEYTSRFDVIVNCTRDIPFSNGSDIEYIRLPIHDDPSESKRLLELAPAILVKIHEAIGKRKRVLVHCYAGMQRSCTLVAMYIMKYYPKIGPSATMKYIQENRPVAFKPTPTFAEALQTFYNGLL